MKHRLWFGGLLLATLMLSACYPYHILVGSGVMTTRELGYADFDSISMSVEGSLSIVHAAEFGVTLTADDNAIDLITVYPAEGGSTLRFALDPGWRGGQISVNIVVRMPRIVSISSAPGPNGRSPDITVGPGFPGADLLSVYVGGGSLDLGTIAAQNVSIETYASLTGDITCNALDVLASYHSSIDLTGSANSIDLRARRNSDVNLSSFPVGDAAVRIEDYSVVRLRVASTLWGTVESHASFSYTEVGSRGSVDVSGLTIEPY